MENRDSLKKEKIAIKPESLNDLKMEMEKAKFPLIEEYAYKRDTKNPDLAIELKSNTIVRDYQD